MGFDLYGIQPKNVAGKYFRNNIWFWPMLWELCCKVAPELSADDRRSGHHNDGHTITGEKHEALIRGLRSALENKEEHTEWLRNHGLEGVPSAAFAMRVFTQVSKAYPQKACLVDSGTLRFEWSNVEDFLEFLEGNEGFEIC